jgi:hypothetical protein
MNKKAQAAGEPMNYVILIIIGVLVVAGTFYLMIRSGLTQRVNELPFTEYEVDETVPVASDCPVKVGELGTLAVGGFWDRLANFISPILYPYQLLRLEPRDNALFAVGTPFFINQDATLVKVANNNIDAGILIGKVEGSGKKYLRLYCWGFDTNSQLYKNVPGLSNSPLLTKFLKQAQGAFIYPIVHNGVRDVCSAAEKDVNANPFIDCQGRTELLTGIKRILSLGELISIKRGNAEIVSKVQQETASLSSSEGSRCKTRPLILKAESPNICGANCVHPLGDTSYSEYFYFVFDNNQKRAYIGKSLWSTNTNLFGTKAEAYFYRSNLCPFNNNGDVSNCDNLSTLSDLGGSVPKFVEKFGLSRAEDPAIADNFARSSLDVLGQDTKEGFASKLQSLIATIYPNTKNEFQDFINGIASSIRDDCANTWYCDFGAGPVECSINGADICSKTDSTKCISYSFGDQFNFRFGDCIYTYELRGDMLKKVSASC